MNCAKTVYTSKTKVILLIFLLIPLLAACNISSSITEGTVIEKKHHVADSTIIMMPIMRSDGKTVTTQMIPMTKYYPEAWEIKIANYDKKSNKEVNNSFYVSKNVYESVAVKDYFKFDKSMGSQQRPIE